MQDVVKNATTEGVKLISGQNITGELTMKLKTLLHSCTMDIVNILLMDCNHDYTETKIKIRERIDFYDFIDTYGDNIVSEWKISNGCGIPWMLFYLPNLVVKNVKPTIKPTSREELEEIIEKTIEEQGTKCDLNFIDTSLITDMSYLFAMSKFNGNISSWDVSKVRNMCMMFANSPFNQDISKWNVSNVEQMNFMFYQSQFNQDISKWDITNARELDYMFDESQFDQDLSNWRCQI